jgi:hypothetical protein
MKKFLFILVTASLLLLSLPAQVSAVYNPFEQACQGDVPSDICDTPAENPVSGANGVILNTVQIVSFVIGVTAVLVIMYGGFKYITANGDANSISSAKNTIMYAVIGLLLSLLSQAIVIFVLNNISG